MQDPTTDAAAPRLFLAGIWLSAGTGAICLAMMLVVGLGGLRASQLLDALGAHWATTPGWLEFIDLASAAAFALAVMLRMRLSEWRALQELRAGRAV
jgi:hypothetical protein